MKIFIIGGGFAGIAAAKKLGRKLGNKKEIELFCIDKNEYTTMLPNLPELAGNRLEKEHITEKITKLIPKNVKFLKEEIKDLNFIEKKIVTKDKEYIYDYLIFAPGSTTNFFGFNKYMDKVHVLQSVESAVEIRKSFEKELGTKEKVNLVISGAGFTGLELACNLYDFAKKKNKKVDITLVEIGKRLVPMLSEKMADHVAEKLKRLNFTVLMGNQIEDFDGENITVKDGTVIKEVFFCWCSGVKSAIVAKGNQKMLPDYRIIVDKNLSIPEHPEVFVAGDGAAIKNKSNYIRRAVNFAAMSGSRAAENLIAVLEHSEMKVFKPIDLGWVIPIYISSIGVAMGIQIKGRIGIFLHYMICGFKNYNMKNFWKEMRCAFKYFFTKA